MNTGARYNPISNIWTATTAANAPDGRIAHAAVWTGSEMVVWGGYNFQQNEFFNTVADTTRAQMIGLLPPRSMHQVPERSLKPRALFGLARR